MRDPTLWHIGPDTPTEEIAHEALTALMSQARDWIEYEADRGPFKEGGRAERGRLGRIEFQRRSLDHLGLLRDTIRSRLTTEENDAQD